MMVVSPAPAAATVTVTLVAVKPKRMLRTLCAGASRFLQLFDAESRAIQSRSADHRS